MQASPLELDPLGSLHGKAEAALVGPCPLHREVGISESGSPCGMLTKWEEKKRGEEKKEIKSHSLVCISHQVD